MAHIIERVDREGGELGWIIVVDNNGGSLSNISLDNAKFIIQVFDYYPQGMRHCFSVDLPWILRAITNLILSLCGQKLREIIHVVDSQVLEKEIDTVLIPVELKNGKRQKKMWPNNLVSLRECADKFNLDAKFLEKFYKAHNF